MTALLMLLFVSICFGIEAHRQYKKKHAANVSDVMYHREVGFTLADGGKKIDAARKEDQK